MKTKNFLREVIKKVTLQFRGIKYLANCFLDILSILVLSVRYLKPPQILINVSLGFLDENNDLLGKKEIFDKFKKSKPSGYFFAETFLVKAGKSQKEKMTKAKKFIKEVGFPVVAKPNVGMCGIGIKTFEKLSELQNFISSIKVDYVLQPFVGYEHDLGVFYIKRKGRGKIIGVGERIFPVITGDGKKTISSLIENFSYNKKIVSSFLHSKKLSFDSVLNKREKLSIIGAVEPGTAYYYKDRRDLITKEALEVFNKITKNVKGLGVGRFDIRVENLKEFARNGRGFKILEFNPGPDVVPIHFGDKKYGIIRRRIEKFKIWDLTFRIAIEKRSKTKISFLDLMSIYYRFLASLKKVER